MFLNRLNKNKIHMQNIVILLLLCIIVFAPHFQSGIFRGLDDSFHLSRIYSLSQSIRNGVFPVKVHSYMCYGTGYGAGFGYSNLFIYIPALLICLGFSLTQSYKIYVFMILITLSLAAYYSLFCLTKKAGASLIGCIIILLSNRIWWDIYGLMSLGSLQASVFILPAIIGMYRFLIDEDVHPKMLSIGFIGLIYSHTISAFLTFTVCACLVVCFCGKLIKNKKKMKELIFAVVFVLGVTIAFWLPLIEQMKKQLLKVNMPWTTAEQNVESIDSMLSIRGLGLMPVLMLIFSVIVLLYLKARKRYLFHELYMKSCFGLIAVVYIILTMCYPFWHFMNSVVGITIIQFPYRLYTPVTFLCAVQVAILIPDISIGNTNRKLIALLGSVLTFALVFIQYNHYGELFGKIDNSIVEAVENNSIAGIGGGEEWLPANGNREYMMDTEIAIDNDGNKVKGTKSKGYSVYTVTIDTGKDYYDLPYVYYKGYQAIGENGTDYEVELNYDTGMLRMLIPSDLSGTDKITVTYVGTKYQKLAYLITLCALCIGGIFIRKEWL